MLHDIRVLGKSETLSYSFRIEQECIDKVLVCISAHVQSFSTVEEKWDLEVFCSAFVLEFQEFGDEVFDRSSFALFTHEIKSCINQFDCSVEGIGGATLKKKKKLTCYPLWPSLLELDTLV